MHAEASPERRVEAAGAVLQQERAEEQRLPPWRDAGGGQQGGHGGASVGIVRAAPGGEEGRGVGLWR